MPIFGIGGKSKVPSLDTGALERIRADSEAKKKSLITGLRPGLQPFSTQFQTQRADLSRQIPTTTENTIGQYRTDLAGVGAQEKAAGNLATQNFREQSFRDVPELQRSIRESLGGSGLLQNAAAASTLARPTLEANRAARDFESQTAQNQIQNEASRQTGLASTGFNARTSAMKDKLGLDKETIDYLTSIGRTDLIDEANNLLGVEEQAGADKLGIEQARQANEMAKAAANASRRSGVLSSLGSLAGAGIGAFGGPMGVALGSQLGGMAGNFAGGGSGGTFDPTLLYAMSQRQPSNRANVVRSLSGGRSTMPGFSPY